MVDLHRHDMFSRFDGFGKPLELAAYAKSLGYTAFATTNHGNTNGLVQTHDAALRAGLKPILGVEGYFVPKYKERHRGFHLCLYAKNLAGYRNLNEIQFEGEKQKYYNPIWTFDMLEEFHDGLICTSACVAGFLAQAIKAGNDDMARNYLRRMVQIFGDDFYVEIQPYKISEPGLQERVNLRSMELAADLGVKCILTSDSHYGPKEDWPTYLKMHEMDGHDLDSITATYKQRYMPRPDDLGKRFVKMHGDAFPLAKRLVRNMYDNLEELEAKVDGDILGQLPLMLPEVVAANGQKHNIVSMVKDGLKRRGKYNKEYIKRCKMELEVIEENGFGDYFVMVADYVNWAKSRGICVGPGRGSACNCLVAYALGITDVDSVEMGLDFRRFMRKDKKALPDIDVDFEMGRRDEVIDYVVGKYPGQAVRISSYGLYKVDNTINALAKSCGLAIDKTVDSHVAQANRSTLAAIKAILRRYKLEDGSVDQERLFGGPDAKQVREYNRQYDNIIIHFCKLFDKVRFIGTHAAGVAITDGDILQYTAIRLDKTGNMFSTYNLDDLNLLNVVKFDLLGLKTMQSLGECRKLAGVDGFDVSRVHDEKVLQSFAQGNTRGIFQFESNAAKKILMNINVDSFADIVATNAMNRPGPIGMGVPDQYAENKRSGVSNQYPILDRYLGETYGTIVYQEQLMLICVEIGGLDWAETDFVLKANKHGYAEKAVALLDKYKADKGVDIPRKFVKNAMAKGIDRDTAKSVWNSLLHYSFNKGHASGYCIIASEEMFYKVYYPAFFWYTKLKYARDDKEKFEYTNNAVQDGAVVFLPHVNYSVGPTSIRKVEGEWALQLGLEDMKGIGAKVSIAVVDERKRNGVFVSYDDFYDRCIGKGKPVNARALAILKSEGAIEFDKKVYIKRVTAFNTASFSRALK